MKYIVQRAYKHAGKPGPQPVTTGNVMYYKSCKVPTDEHRTPFEDPEPFFTHAKHSDSHKDNTACQNAKGRVQVKHDHLPDACFFQLPMDRLVPARVRLKLILSLSFIWIL